MLYYPIDPNAGAGEQMLIGAAHIRRTADIYCAASTYVEMLRNCELVNAVGDAGILDSVTGKITIPAGARTVRFTLSQGAAGNASIAYTRLYLDISGQSNLQRQDSGLRQNLIVVVSADCSTDSLASILVYFTSAYTVPSDSLSKDLGIVEFFA